MSPQFFRTMGTPLLDGREFQASDSDAASPMPATHVDPAEALRVD